MSETVTTITEDNINELSKITEPTVTDALTPAPLPPHPKQPTCQFVCNEFDFCRTQVAKDCTAAYLNFRFSTQHLIEKVVVILGKFNDKPRALYAHISPDLNIDSSHEQIETSYIQKIRYYETLPEAERSDNHTQLVEKVKNAYEILGDPIKKKSYDALGLNEKDVSLEWSKQVHKFATEIAMSWDKNDPPGVSVRLLHVLKDVADGSVNYVIISFILVLYITGLGVVAAIAPNIFIQLLVGVLQWLGFAGGVIEHVKNLGSTLANITVHSTDILNKTVQSNYGKDISDKIFVLKPGLVDYLDSVLVTLKEYSREMIETLDVNDFEQKVKLSFKNDCVLFVDEFLVKQQTASYNEIKSNWTSHMFIDRFSEMFIQGRISRSLFYVVLSEIVLNEMYADPQFYYPFVERSVELIEKFTTKYPWIPLFILAEGRDHYSLGAWTRFTESVDWNKYNILKERIENDINWRSYDHQLDFFKIHMKHLSETGLDVATLFPRLSKSCKEGPFKGEPSDTQWKTRHLVLYAHGTMAPAVKLLRKFRLKSR